MFALFAALMGPQALAAPMQPADDAETVGFAPAPDVEEGLEAPAPRHTQGFLGGERVVFDKPHADVFGAGETVEVAAPVDDNAFLAGRMIVISAPVGGDVFAAGETVQIDRPVGGDVFAAGADVLIGPDGSVGGEVYGFGRTVVLSGPLDGSLHAGAGRVELGARIGGDVEVEVGELVMVEGAQVVGDLDYVAPQPTPGIEGFVDGQVTFSEQTDDDFEIDVDLDPEELEAIEAAFAQEEEDSSFLSAAIGWTSWWLWDYLSKLIVGAVFLALGGAASVRVAKVIRDTPAESLGIGFVTLVLLPPLALLCMATIIPLSLGILTLMALGVLMFLGQIVTAQWLGDLFLQRVRPGSLHAPRVALAVGLVPVCTLFMMPTWISFLAVLSASLIGMGAIVTTIVRRDGAAADPA